MPWLILLTALTAHGAPRIVGGQPSEPGVWPDTVAVKLQGSYQCTGTLVAPRLVLTAAHCDSNIESVLVNSTDYADSSQGEEIPVVASYSYPRPYETYDVAVLVLEYEASVPARTVAARCVTDTHL